MTTWRRLPVVAVGLLVGLMLGTPTAAAGEIDGRGEPTPTTAVESVVQLDRLGSAVVPSGTGVTFTVTVTGADGVEMPGVQVRLKRQDFGRIDLDTCPEPATGGCPRTDQSGQLQHILDHDLDGHALIVATAHSDSGDLLGTSEPATIEFVQFVSDPSGCGELDGCASAVRIRGFSSERADVVEVRSSLQRRARVVLHRKERGGWRSVGKARSVAPSAAVRLRVRDTNRDRVTRYRVRARTAEGSYWSNVVRVR